MLGRSADLEVEELQLPVLEELGWDVPLPEPDFCNLAVNLTLNWFIPFSISSGLKFFDSNFCLNEEHNFSTSTETSLGVLSANGSTG